MTAPVLTTERLVLRPHCLADFDDVAALWADPAVVKYISGKPSSREASWARLLRYIGHWQALDYGYWAVCDRVGGAYLGGAGFGEYQRQISPPLPQAPEAGWALTPRVHGRGLAAEAVARMHQWADEARDWPQTVAIMDPDHAASQHVASKLGYRKTQVADYDGEPVQVMCRTNPASG
jgi:RimJ/RimL family protein N-acetyltransferase